MRHAILIGLAVLVVAVTTAVCTPPAQALEGSDADKAWALKWERQAAKNERHARQHGRFLGHGGKLPWYLSYEIPRSDFETWREYGARIKRRAYSLAVRVKRTWRKMRYPAWRTKGADAWIPLARHAGWPASATPMLRKVIRRESSGNPRCRLGVHRGLLQIRRDHCPSVDLYNPYSNLRYGLRMWKRLGWDPWAQTAW